MAAFLIGAGEYAYYHCAPAFPSSTNTGFPDGKDYWLEWLPEYDRALGEPSGDGVNGTDGVWTRSFASGTKVAFDGVNQNGTIWSGSIFPPLSSLFALSSERTNERIFF